MDITQLILDDHHEQRRRFAILEQIDSADVRSLDEIWQRLAVFLEVHAAAEEAIFYPELLKLAIGPAPVGTAEPETIDAIHDHNEIRDAIAAVVGVQVGSQAWRDAVADVNRANGDHMAEEEREGLTDFRRRVSLAERHSLAVAFAAFEARNFAGVKPVDQDPETYVRQQEEAARARSGPGSLGIGDLKGGS
jgi:Hemerythrin HHE cation binding domain